MPRLLPTLLAALLPALLRADVVINEIMYHPSSEKTTEEYIELHNTGSAAVNLGGWSFTSGVGFTFPNTSIPAGGYVVVAADRAAFSTKYPGVTNVVGGWTGRLSNAADNIVLRDNRGVKIDEVEYADDGDWALRERDDVDSGHRGWRWRSAADGFGRSLELINSNFDNNHGQNWGASTQAEGTPGTSNSIAATDVSPLISSVRHHPLVPTSAEAVTVNATVVDDHGGAVTVTINYRKDGAASWSTAPMFDDGVHNDGIAGDRIFGAQLPAQADDSIVEFFVSASDGSRLRTWPAPAFNNPSPTGTMVAEQSQNCLYQVEDAAQPAAIPLYRFVMKAADRSTLEAINYGEGSGSHSRFNSTFITIDGTGAELRYLTGVRNRGHGSATLQPQSFSVAIPNDWDWNGRTALNLNSQFSYLQLLGSAFMRRAGLVAPESRPVQMRVNNVDLTAGSNVAPSFGFYVCNEFQDSAFASHHFPADDGGSIYSVRRTDFPPHQEGDFTYLAPGGVNGADPYRKVYSKNTNSSEDNWSDLFALTQSLAKGRFTTLLASPTWDTGYVTAVEAKVDVDQWLTWFAAQALVGNGETSLANGYGDDFYLYLGVTDPRARLIPYDLDTILGDGDDPVSSTGDIFQMIRHRASSYTALSPTPLYPLLRHPTFGARYFSKLQQLLSGPLSIANFNALADQTLAGLVGPSIIAQRKTWYATRHAYVSGLVSPRLTVTSGPAVHAGSGYPVTQVPTCNLAGKTDPARTQRVKVNGIDANYVPWQVITTAAASNSYTAAIGEWSLPNVPLQPGLNRVLIEALDASGTEIDRSYYEVWFDDSSVTAVSGSIATNTTWTAAGGPYQVSATLTVESGVALTIEPGTTIYLGSNVGINVTGGGRILAEGTATSPIHFTRAPGTTTHGGSITIRGVPGVAETRFRHVFFNFGGDPAVTCETNSNVVFDHCEWLRNDIAYLDLNGGSFLISNCIFPSAPPTAFFEAIHGLGTPPAGGRAIIRDSFFGKMNGYNDVIDFTGGNRSGTILQVYNNVFLGTDDDVLDIDGTDAWIEGNIFMHVHRLGSPDSASAVSGGNALGQTSEITIVGNLFFDVDQAVTAKEGNFFTFLNNTVVDQNSRGSDERREDIANQPDVFLPAVFNLGDHEAPRALGLYVEGNVIHSAEKLLRNFTGAERVTFNHNLLPANLTWPGAGTGNISADALLSDVGVDAATGVSNIPTPTKDNYRQVVQEIRKQFGLDARSLARGSGPNGTDQGAIRSLGVSLRGAPIDTTNATTATITVGTLMTGSGIPTGPAQFPSGSGWTHYKWRMDAGAWSAETPLATPISITGLANGTHTLEVVGKNDANTFQDSADLGSSARIASATWKVDTSFVPPETAVVRINEVLASNATTMNFGTVFPDLIEVTNIGNVAVNISGWGLSDNAALPYKYVFPAGSNLAPGAYLVVYASNSASVPSPRTGFALGASGDDLTLTRSVASGGGVADTVTWGQQLTDYSIGRGPDGAWTLCRPTFGAVNVRAAQSATTGVTINEWLAEAGPLFGDDFIELHNPGRFPVDLGGHYLTDNPVSAPDRSPIRQLTFISAGGFLSFKADADAADGPDHVDFRLPSLQGEIGFMSPALKSLDHIFYGAQRTDISQGRAPDGAGTIITMLPTPAVANRPSNFDTDRDGMPDTWEIDRGLDPNNPADGSFDNDNDGQSNLAEYLAGTDPRDPKNTIRIPRDTNLLKTGRLINLSILAPLVEGEVMTIGAAIGGAGTSGAKAIVVRAAGPALTQLGVGGVLPDPKMMLINQVNGVTVAANNDWSGDPTLSTAFAQVGAFPYSAATSKDAGIAPTTLAVSNYTVQVSDVANGAGTVIAELYDATPDDVFTATTPRLINVSVLKQVRAGTTLTAGFVIDGSTPKTVLVRAVGPTLGLAPFNVPGVMADPALALFNNASKVKIDDNNDWGGTSALSARFASVGAFALANGTTKDAALLVTVPPGQYTVQVSGADGGGGLVIVEIYDVP